MRIWFCCILAAFLPLFACLPEQSGERDASVYLGPPPGVKFVLITATAFEASV
jgi:hypothetical protein